MQKRPFPNGVIAFFVILLLGVLGCGQQSNDTENQPSNNAEQAQSTSGLDGGYLPITGIKPTTSSSGGSTGTGGAETGGESTTGQSEASAKAAPPAPVFRGQIEFAYSIPADADVSIHLYLLDENDYEAGHRDTKTQHHRLLRMLPSKRDVLSSPIPIKPERVKVLPPNGTRYVDFELYNMDPTKRFWLLAVASEKLGAELNYHAFSQEFP